MTHEIMDELARRARDLPDRDGSHYQTVKLVVQQQGRRQAIVSLVVTDAGRHRLQDTRLGFAIVSSVDQVGRQLPPHLLLQRALSTLQKQLDQGAQARFH